MSSSVISLQLENKHEDKRTDDPRWLFIHPCFRPLETSSPPREKRLYMYHNHRSGLIATKVDISLLWSWKGRTSTVS